MLETRGNGGKISAGNGRRENIWVIKCFIAPLPRLFSNMLSRCLKLERERESKNLSNICTIVVALIHQGLIGEKMGGRKKRENSALSRGQKKTRESHSRKTSLNFSSYGEEKLRGAKFVMNICQRRHATSISSFDKLYVYIQNSSVSE